MKKIFLLTTALIFSTASFSQSCTAGFGQIFTNFDSLNDTAYYNNFGVFSFSINTYLDTNNSNNIWQHGVPQKTIFNNIATNKKAIITDTSNFYLVNNTSEAIFKIDQNPVTLDCYILGIYYKSDMNVGDTIITYTSQDSVNWSNSVYSFSKNCSNNCNNFILVYWPEKYLKLRFISDSNPENMEGIVIDSICVNFMPCPNVPEQTKELFFIYPNPTNGIINIEFSNDDFKNAENISCKVYDITGKETYNSPLLRRGAGGEVNLNHLQNGLYFLQVSNNEGLNITKKIIIQK